MDLNSVLLVVVGLIAGFGSLAGWAALVAIVINILKTLNIIKDGQAQNWNLGLNSLGLVGLVAVVVFGHVTPAQFDSLASVVALLLTSVLGFVMQFKVSGATHNTLAENNIPFLGKSFGTEKWKEIEAGWIAGEVDLQKKATPPEIKPVV